ncbi:MAG: acyl-CoA dehydrogenase family protein [Proteobacteria bacterium]|nr:acyl-CoA dehydrogenase family protein [Pseudomonadota bacterium]
MKLTEQHQQIRDSAHAFIERQINPHVAAWEQAERFPAHELFRKLGEQGFLGLTQPEAYGGLDLDLSYGLVLAQALGRIKSGGVALAIGVQTDMATPALAEFGSDELRQEFLAPAVAGELVGCIGVSETEAGSDVAAIRTSARKEGQDYVINGGKMWITHGLQADWMCCLVNTSDASPYKNKSLIVIPMQAKGVERARKLKKLGMWASDTAQVFFDNVRVPRRYLIGHEGQGFPMQMFQFQQERLWGAANALGAIEQVLSDTIEYTRSRQAFGSSILDKQWVHFHLAELLTEVEALRALIYEATERCLEGQDVTRLASMAKLKAGRLTRKVADTCLQFWGGMGYMWEASVSRLYRDGRLASIGGGADEVMLSIICKLDGLVGR